MSSYNKLIKNFAIFAIGSFGSKLITLLMLPFYTRNLSQSDFGQIDIINTTIALLIPIFTVNIVEAVVRFSFDKKYYNYGEVISNSIVFIIIGFTILLCLYPLISNISFIEQYGLIFYILFFLQAIYTSIKQFARSTNLMKVYMISDIFYIFIFVSFNIVFIFFMKMEVQGYFISMILAYISDLVYLSVKTKVGKYIRIYYLDKVKMKTMLIYCIPLIPNAIMWWVIILSDRYILVYYMGLSSIGIYAVANQIASIISNFYSIFYKAWQVSAIEESDSSNKNEFYSNVFSIFFFVMVIISSFYMIFNKLVITLLSSNEFYSAWKYAPILVLGVVFSSFSGFIGTNYVAMKKTKGALYTSLVGAIANFLLNIMLIPKYGIFGASIATMISFFTIWVLRIVDTRKFVKINYPVLKMILSLILIGIQLFIGYLNISIFFITIINILILLVIFSLSLEYTKKPIIILNKKFITKR